MISFIRGKVSETNERTVIVDTGALGYKVFVTDDTANGLKVGQEKVFWTHHAVREDVEDLYGFLEKKDRDFFELLITVSGIGPKSALNILSLVAAETLASSIKTGSVAHLVKVSGIGRKTAEKIVLELKDKLGGFEGRENTNMSGDADALEALRALGYDLDEAREALKKLDRSITDPGAKVKAALKVLS